MNKNVTSAIFIILQVDKYKHRTSLIPSCLSPNATGFRTTKGWTDKLWTLVIGLFKLHFRHQHSFFFIKTRFV